MEAGYGKVDYWAWRVGILPDLRIQAALANLNSGWPPEVLKERSSDYGLAKRWLEAQAQEKNPSRSSLTGQAFFSSDESSYSSDMTSREAKELIQQEIEEGKQVTLEAFEKALRQAARKARCNPEDLPVQLGGQHKDWQLVELGPESGGHGKGHQLRRRVPHTRDGGNSSL